MDWCTIESDPEVFTELLTDMGVKDVIVKEMYTLDISAYEGFGQTYGLIFLFNLNEYNKSSGSRHMHSGTDIFFASQMVENACATQALLSIVLNADVQLGDTLSQLKKFSKDFPPELKGVTIGNNQRIRAAHNKFARRDLMIARGRARVQARETFHFVAFIPHEGFVFELDGLRSAPLAIGAITTDNWLHSAIPAIKKRIDRCKGSDLSFNLMAVVPDRGPILRRSLGQATARLARLNERIKSCEHDVQDADGKATPSLSERDASTGATSTGHDNTTNRDKFVPTSSVRALAETADPQCKRGTDSAGVPGVASRSPGPTLSRQPAAAAAATNETIAPQPAPSTESTAMRLQEEKAKVTATITALKTQMHEHERDKALARSNNERRKHDYTPFIRSFLQTLQSKRKLIPLIQETRTRKKHSGSKRSRH